MGALRDILESRYGEDGGATARLPFRPRPNTELGAIERGMQNARLGQEVGALNWEAEQAEKVGNEPLATGLRQRAALVSSGMTQGREFTDFLPSGQASLSELPAYLGEAVGGGIHSASQITPAALGGAALGAGATLLSRGRIPLRMGATVGGLTGAAIPGYNMNTEETALQLSQDPTIKANTTAAERIDTARGTGLGMTALDVIPGAVIAGQLTRPLRTAGLREAVKQATMGTVAKDVGQSMGAEALTGGGQAYMQQLGQQSLNPDHQISDKEIMNSAAAEALGASPMAMGTAAMNYGAALPAGAIKDGARATKDFVVERGGDMLDNMKAGADALGLPALVPDSLKSVGGAIGAAASGVKATVSGVKTGASTSVDAVKKANDMVKGAAEYGVDLMDEVRKYREANPDATDVKDSDIIIGRVSEDADNSFSKLKQRFDTTYATSKEKLTDEYVDLADTVKNIADRFETDGKPEDAGAIRHALEAFSEHGFTPKAFNAIGKDSFDRLARMKSAYDQVAERQKKIDELSPMPSKKPAEAPKPDKASDKERQARLDAMTPAYQRTKGRKDDNELFSRSTRGRDQVNQSVREAFADMKIENAYIAEVVDSIAPDVAARFQTKTLKEKGLDKLLRESLDVAIAKAPEGIRSIIYGQYDGSVPSNDTNKVYNVLFKTLKERLGGVNESLKEETDSAAPTTDMRALLEPFVTNLYADKNLDQDTMNGLVDNFNEGLQGYATGEEGRSFNQIGEGLRKRFGAERGNQALEELKVIASMAYGKDTEQYANLSQALESGKRREDLESEMTALFTPEAQADGIENPVDRMLSDYRSIQEKAKASLGPRNSEQYVDGIFNARWGSTLPPENLERAKELMNAYERGGQRITGKSVAKAIKQGQADGGGNNPSVGANFEGGEFDDYTEDSGRIELFNQNFDAKSAKRQMEAEANEGKTNEADAPMYTGTTGINSVARGKSGREDIDIGAPLARIGSEDHETYNGYMDNEFNVAYKAADTEYGPRLTDTEGVTVPQWAAELSAQTGRSESELLNEALDKLIAHDQERLKTVGADSEAAKWIKARSDLANRYYDQYGKKHYGAAFFSSKLGKPYRYLKHTAADGSNIKFNVDKLATRYAPEKGKTVADVAAQKAKLESSVGKPLAAKDVEDSFVTLSVGTDNKSMDVDLAQIVMDQVHRHQQADITGVDATMNDQHVYRPGEDSANAADLFIDPLGNEKDVKAALEGRGKFAQALYSAVNTTIATLLTTPRVFGIKQIMTGSIGPASRTPKKNAQMLIMRQLDPKTVVWRDHKNGRVIRWSDISKFRGVGPDGRAIFRKGIVHPLTKAEIATAITPTDKGKMKNNKNQVVDMKLNEATANEHGIALGAATKDGVSYDLDLHALLARMMERYEIPTLEAFEGIKADSGGNGQTVEKTLAAVLLAEGVGELTSAGYEVNTTKEGPMGKAQVFKGFKGQTNPNTTETMAVKSAEEVAADNEAAEKYGDKTVGEKEEAARYGVEFNSLRQVFDTMMYTKGAGGAPAGSAQAIPFLEKSLKAHAAAAARAELATGAGQQLADLDARTKMGQTSPNDASSRDALMKSVARAVRELEGAINDFNDPAGKVGDGQIDITHDLAEKKNVFNFRQAHAKAEHGGFNIGNTRVDLDGGNDIADSVNVKDDRTKNKAEPKTKDPRPKAEALYGKGEFTSDKKRGAAAPAPTVKELIDAPAKTAKVNALSEKPDPRGPADFAAVDQTRVDARANAAEKATAYLASMAEARKLRRQGQSERVIAREKEQAKRNKKETQSAEPAEPTKTVAEIIAEQNAPIKTESVFDENVPFSKSTRGDTSTLNKALLEAELQAKALFGNLFEIDFVDPKELPNAAGKFDGKKIFVSLASDLLGTTRHEAWHAFESQLKGMGKEGAEILNTIYGHVSSPMMKAWLNKTLIEVNDQGAYEQINNIDPEGQPLTELQLQKERAAYAFQLFMEGKKMPLHSKSTGWFGAIKNFVKAVLSKVGVNFSNEQQRTEAFFKMLQEGGWVRDHDNPAALLRALDKKNGDKVMEVTKRATKPIVDTLSAVFGHTADRLKKYNIPEYDKIVEDYDRMQKNVDRNINALSNDGQATLDAFIKEGGKNFFDSKAWKAFARKMFNYMDAAKMGEGEQRRLFSNLEPFDLDLIDKNFKEFTNDILTAGMADGSGKATDIAQRILDEGFYDGDDNLFKGHPELELKWIKADPKEVIARLLYKAVPAVERNKLFGAKDVDLKARIEAGHAKASSEAKALATKVFDAYEGKLGRDSMTPFERKTQEVLLTFNNMRTMLFGVFSQSLEPLQLAFRKNEMSAAIDSTFRMIKEMPRAFTTLDKRVAPDRWERLAMQQGIIASDIVRDVLSQMHNGIKTTGKIGWLNDKFFQYNFMRGVDRSNRISATKHAVEFIKEHAEGMRKGDKHSTRWMEELDLTPDDVVLAQNDAGLQLSDKVGAAIHKYVSQALAHPDTSSNALWMNDERFALIAHMKRFTFSHTRYILGRGYNELKNGNVMPLMPLLLSVPWMITADALKDMVKPGEEKYKDAWDYTDYALHGIDRAGLLGRAGVMTGGFNAQQFGGSFIESTLGPTAEMFGKVARGMSEGQTARALLEVAPASQLWN